MNIKEINIKLGIVAVVTIGAILMTTFHSIAIASTGGHCEKMQMSSEEMHVQTKSKLDKLAERLEIKASQQATWEDFVKSVEMLAERSVKKPTDDADAAIISRYRADRAAEFARKLSNVADATAKLQATLTEDQRKILNQAARRFLHNGGHGWNSKHRLDRDDHDWCVHGSSDKEGRHGGIN